MNSRFGGIAMRDVCLDHVIIRAITLYDQQYVGGYQEFYGSSEHDQIQAFECLETVCEEDEVVSSIGQIKEEDKSLSGLIGPKRIEITLKSIGGAREWKLVVTDLMPPSGHYKYYSVKGRPWKVYQKKLDKVPETLWETGNWIARIDAYLGGSEGSATDHYSPQNQEQAWGVLEKMFYKFKPAELTVIKNWDVDEEGEDTDGLVCGYGGEWYGPVHRSQHWTNRTPSAYDTTPKEGYFRVAGDEVGAVIHREQRKIWEEAGSPDPEQSLKEMLEAKEDEKKDEAGETSQSSGTDPNASDDSCPDCGGDDCHPSYCIQDFGFGANGGVAIDGQYTVH